MKFDKLQDYLKSYGAKQVQKIPFLIMPTLLYKIKDNIWFSFDYDEYDHQIDIRLGTLVEFSDVIERILVLEHFEWYLGKDGEYFNNHDLDASIELVISKLAEVVDSFDTLQKNFSQDALLEQERLKTFIVRNLSSFSIEDLESEFKKNEKIELKKERKKKINQWLFIFIYVFIIFILVVGIDIIIIKTNPQIDAQKVSSISIVINCLLIIPPIVAKDLFFDLIHLLKKKNREAARKNKQLAEEKYKSYSDSLREKYHIPSDVLTQYDYNKIKNNSTLTKIKWTILGICEIACLCLVLGIVFYGDVVSVTTTISLVCLGIILGIYGFCFLCEAYFKGIIYSTIPVLCYLSPLLILYYGFKIDNGVSLGVGTMVIGSLLFAIFITIIVLTKKKKEKTLTKYYQNSIFNGPDFYYDNHFSLALYLNNGKYVVITSNNNCEYDICVFDDIVYEKILLKSVIVNRVSLASDDQTAVLKGIELLKK